jgi:hypothetical protein
MTLNMVPQAALLRGRTAAQQRHLEQAINCFPRKHRTAVVAEAARNFTLAYLALSFPALLFVIAIPHEGIDADKLRRQVIAGQSLKILARLAGLPMWLRKLHPSAFEDVLSDVPRDELISRQISNYIPRRSKHHVRWLWRISHACRWGHEGFALWMARAWKDQSEQRRHDYFNMLALWAWYSLQPDTEFGRLVQKRWCMDMDWKQAVASCTSWIESVHLHLAVHIESRLPKFTAREMDGFAFVHLATGEMLADEAVAMRNCIKSCGYDIAWRDNELWSMRKDGARIATFCIGVSSIDRLPAIIEFKQANNKPVTREVALAARRWFAMHDLSAIQINPKDLPDDALRHVWQRGFRPYWLAKRAFPAWLRLSGHYRLKRI